MARRDLLAQPAGAHAVVVADHAQPLDAEDLALHRRCKVLYPVLSNCPGVA
jgi:hypothetical protein